MSDAVLQDQCDLAVFVCRNKTHLAMPSPALASPLSVHCVYWHISGPSDRWAVAVSICPNYRSCSFKTLGTRDEEGMNFISFILQVSIVGYTWQIGTHIRWLIWNMHHLKISLPQFNVITFWLRYEGMFFKSVALDVLNPPPCPRDLSEENLKLQWLNSYIIYSVYRQKVLPCGIIKLQHIVHFTYFKKTWQGLKTW